MGKKSQGAKVRKFAAVKKTLKATDPRLKKGKEKSAKEAARELERKKKNQVPAYSSALFLSHNEQLGPPYHVLVDTNFFNFALKNKIDVVDGMVDCLYAKCIPVVLNSVMAELESLGDKFKTALALSKDPRMVRMPGVDPRATYADDDIVATVTAHRCFIVATCDADLRRRIRKIPGVPIMYISRHQFTVERMPEAFGAPR